MNRLLRLTLAVGLGCSLMAQAPQAAPAAATDNVLKATLANGLRVVIVRNALAPVVSTDMTYLVGSRDDPAGVPGMAHAQEHMMFRGTKELSTSQLGTIATALGGDFNASTSDTTTQYQFTVPSADLDAVLRIESDRMRGVLDLQSEWQNERGAIEQEVLRDETQPGADLFRDAQQIAYAGTPYGHEGVGTRASFDKLTGPEMKTFHDTWYAPNNAVFVLAGNVDPVQALAQIRARFESIPRRTVPVHAAAHLRPLARTVFERNSTLAYPLAAVGFRMPGLTSKDFLASFVLQGILGSERGPLRPLVDRGEALSADWLSESYVPEAQLGFAVAALRPGASPKAVTQTLERTLRDYVQHGVPRELFESTKRLLIVGQEESRNSITSLASDWATTIALDNEPSIAREQQLIEAVTLADVNRVAKRYLDPQHAIVGALTPSANASQTEAPSAPQQGAEKPLAPHPAVTQLPGWANALVGNVAVPPVNVAPTRMTLPNGITLIVQPESISDSVFVYGRVRTNSSLQEPSGQEGVASVLNATFDYGTRTRDRDAFQRALDDSGTQMGAGQSFAMETPARSFDHGVALLAENELQPRFDQTTFEQARRRAVEGLQTALNTASTVAARRAAHFLLPPNDPETREPSVGQMEALSLADVQAYYAKTMRPDLTTIVVVGNVTPETARAAIERDFGGWHANGPTPNVELPPLPLNPPGDVDLPLPIGQDAVRIEQIVPIATTDAAVYPLLVGNAILGGGSLGPDQSRLFRDLRQEAGLVYTVASSLAPRRSRYEFAIEYACLPSNNARIASLIDAEIARMQTEPVGAFELSLAKASLVRHGVVGGASVSAIGSSLLEAATNGLPFDQQQVAARHILATDAHAVQQSFATAIQPNHFVRTVQGP